MKPTWQLNRVAHLRGLHWEFIALTGYIGPRSCDLQNMRMLAIAALSCPAPQDFLP